MGLTASRISQGWPVVGPMPSLVLHPTYPPPLILNSTSTGQTEDLVGIDLLEFITSI
jgi:hypothetical protein